jgi:plastocyanin
VNDVWREVAVLAVLLAVIAFVLTVFDAWPNQSQSYVLGHRLPPPTLPTQAQLQQLAQSPPFQYVVSYTDKGFQPAVLTVKKGDTVRFANNSTGQLWVADAHYASSASSCGGSAFDSCGALQPSNYWEFTFDRVGTWKFQNNANTQYAGTIIVSGT